jgi:hypothetical protein
MTWALSLVAIIAMSDLTSLTSHALCWIVGSDGAAGVHRRSQWRIDALNLAQWHQRALCNRPPRHLFMFNNEVLVAPKEADARSSWHAQVALHGPRHHRLQSQVARV